SQYPQSRKRSGAIAGIHGEVAAAQGLERRIDDARSSEPRISVHLIRLAVIDKEVRHYHRPDLEAAVEQARLREMMQHIAAETADGALFDGDQHLVVAREAVHQFLVERFGETGVSNGGGEAESCELIRRLQAFGEACAER